MDRSGVVKTLRAEIERLQRAVELLEGTGGRRTLSPEARKKIAAAQRKRWAKIKGKKRG